MTENTEAPVHSDRNDGFTATEATHLADQVQQLKPPPWTPNMFRLYGVMLCAYFCACLNGFEGSVMVGLNAMTSYQDYFHMKTASSSTGLVFAIYGIGTICATPFVGPTNDYLGRRAVMFTGSVIVIVGAVVVGASTSKGMFLAGRFVLGFGVAFCNVSAPVYVGKMAHPVWHGQFQHGKHNCRLHLPLGISYAFGWTPLSPIYIVECLETSTRAKGKAFAQLLTAAAATTIQYGSGPAFEKIKYYFYIVFIGWDIIQLLVIYFFWPETKGRTLEELDEVFKAPNPVKKSLEPINVQTIISTSNAQKDHDGQV